MSGAPAVVLVVGVCELDPEEHELASARLAIATTTIGKRRNCCISAELSL